MKSIRILISLLPALALLACGSRADEPGEGGANPYTPISLSEKQIEIAQSHNAFAARLFSQMESRIDGNTVFSPLSLSLNLTMVANGALDNTRSEILATLGLNPADISEANSLGSLLMAELPRVDKKVSVALANSIWSHSPIKESFANNCSNKFGASFFTWKGDQTTDRNAINKWVSDNTKGLIPQFFSSEERVDNEATHIFNALYFKGEWASKFDKNNTAARTFHNADGTSSRPKMMNGAVAAKCWDDDDHSGLRMSYGNGAYTFTAIMPKDGQTMSGVMTRLFEERVFAQIDSRQLDMVSVTMPKVNMQADNDLKEVLMGLGIKDAFSANANFKAMLEAGGKIEKVRQQVLIDISEEGTEAAAATQTQMGDILNMPSKSITLNRPFFFLISERSTGAVLFMGKVSQL